MRRKLTYDPQRDYYAILGVDATATPEQLRLAYRRCVREVHPDLNPQRADWATEQIQVINEAYAVLRQPTRRREYDRLRWPHVPSQPAASPTGYHSFRAPYYDHDRPWWEQVAEQAPRANPFASDVRSRPRRRGAASDPIWLAVSAWLKGHGLGRLQPTWLTLVGLWRGPYAGLLMFLGFVLAINVAVIIYAFMTPDAWDDLDALFSPQEGAAVADGTPTTTAAATPDQLFSSCLEPGVQITQPVRGDIVGDRFSIYGTVDHPDMWSYRIDVGYIGRMFNLAVVPSTWEIVRSAPRNQSIPEPPIVDDLLTEMPVNLEGRPTGYYVIRLQVILPDESTLMPCDVIVRR